MFTEGSGKMSASLRVGVVGVVGWFDRLLLSRGLKNDHILISRKKLKETHDVNESNVRVYFEGK